MQNMNLKEQQRKQQIETCCKKITTFTKKLIKSIGDLENTSEDAEAYYIMHLIDRITHEMNVARNAGIDEYGTDELDTEESVADAIRAAKEAV